MNDMMSSEQNNQDVSGWFGVKLQSFTNRLYFYFRFLQWENTLNSEFSENIYLFGETKSFTTSPKPTPKVSLKRNIYNSHSFW